jgi:quercetin dioxygenase-like cupin family protein
MTAFIGKSDLPGTGSGSVRFEIPNLHAGVSMFLVDVPPGKGPGPHRHPYPETFVVQSGAVRFVVDGKTIDATEGDIVIVHPGETHQFTNRGEQHLRMTCIHAADRMETDWD